MNKLLGGQAFHVPTKLSLNGFCFDSKTLADTGASGYLFINTDYAIALAKHLGHHVIRLPKSLDVSGFNGAKGSPITHAIVLHLWIDGHRFLDQPFLITPLGSHDVIVGRKWMEDHDCWLDVKNHKIVWPEDRTPAENIQSDMQRTVPRQILKRPTASVVIDPNVDRNGVPLSMPTHKEGSQVKDQKDSLRKMEEALKGLIRTIPPPVKRLKRFIPEVPTYASIDISLIGAVPFHRHAKKPGNEIAIVTLQEIERVLEEKTEANRDPDIEDEVYERLPKQYLEYADVFSKKKSDELPPHRPNADHRIEIEGDPREVIGYGPLYKMTAEELEAARDYILDNLQKGFIVPSDAPFASPILLVKKKEGGMRLCVDYRKLNSVTKKDRYPLPLIDELMERLSKAKIFTKLDIRQGFHRLRMAEEHEDLTTFRTRYGSYKYKVMPFGLTNGPASFQRYINSLFIDYLDVFLTAYVDDLLIYSNNEAEHEMHVKMVLERLRSAGLQASIKKCEFHVTRTKYLGFIVTTEGIEVDPEKVAIVRKWERPTTVKGVQSFLGFCNFYRRFIRDYSKTAKPLTRLTRKDQPFIWSDTQQQAFDELKEKLTSAPVLTHYRPGWPTRLETDASDEIIAGVLSQQNPDTKEWHPIAFYSSNMSPAERNYDIHDKEMLAIVRALEEWRAELEGLQLSERFDVLTDHQALQYFMTTKKLNARQARWAEFLSRFFFCIRYRPGKQNTLADAMTRRETQIQKDGSRMTILLKPEQLDDKIKDELKIAAVSHTDIVDELITANKQSPSLADLAKTKPQLLRLENGLYLHDERLAVPNDDTTLRTRLLDEIHRQLPIAHPGQRKMKELISSRYWWPGWSSDVDRYVRNCWICRRNENPRDKTPGLLKPLPIPLQPWKDISMDFRTFPKDKKGYDYAMVIVDRLSKKIISIPCHKTVNARDVADLFLVHYYRHYGAPDTIVSDRGGQFVSEFWKEFCQLLGIQLKLSTSHHPQTDGQTEIVNQLIVNRLRPFIDHYQNDWSDKLPVLDHAAATLVQDSIGVSPFQLVYGYQPRTSFDWRESSDRCKSNPDRQEAASRIKQLEDAWNFARNNMAKAQERQATQANKHRRPVDFDVGDHVWLDLRSYRLSVPSRKLAEQRAGPFTIVEKVGHSFRLDLPDSFGIHPVISPDKLRKAADDALPGQHKDPQPATRVNDQDEWEVERVLASRLYRRKLEYRVKWVGADDDPTWYPARNFKGSPHLVRDFHQAHPDAAGPPSRLNDWLIAWEKGEELPDIAADDLPRT